MSDSQNTAILSHLKTGKSITPIDALERFDCFRLGARIYDLKQAGHVIHKDMVPTDSGKHVASYTMVRHG
jgi:hypothetical protein